MWTYNDQKRANAKWYKKTKPIRKKHNHNYHKTLKLEVIKKYGNKCRCCGETILAFLTIDHINNKTIKDKQYNGTVTRYIKLRDSPKRKDIQVLCMNCNFAKYFEGMCPHKKMKTLKHKY